MRAFRIFQYIVVFGFWGVLVPGFVLFYLVFFVLPYVDG